MLFVVHVPANKWLNWLVHVFKLLAVGGERAHMGFPGPYAGHRVGELPL